MRFKAILFDLDGTLVDSLADIGQAMNHALVLHGARPIPLNDYRDMVGDGVRNLVARAHPEGTPEAHESLLSSFRAFYADHLTASTRPFPGIETLLSSCLGRGQKLAVLSNKAHAFTQALVQRLLPEVPFEAVWGEQPALHPRKPAPDPALALCKELGVAPSEAVLVGDTVYDLQCALNAGLTPVGVTWGFRSREQLEALELSGVHLVDDVPALQAFLTRPADARL